MADIQTYSTKQEIASAAADLFVELGSLAIHNNGRFSVALSGGSTPIALYKLLIGEEFDQLLDWERIHFFWGDERPVPPDHQESNYRHAEQELLLPRSIKQSQIHRIYGELDPTSAAARYQEEVLNHFHPEAPAFDLILLGMGADSHTASLFPGTDLVNSGTADQELFVAATWVEKMASWRITFTPRLINLAKSVVFLAAGEDKADALQAVLEGAHLPMQHPAQLVAPISGDLVWLVDKKAAAKLRNIKK